MKKNTNLILRCEESLKDKIKYICKMEGYKNMSATIEKLVNQEYRKLKKELG